MTNPSFAALRIDGSSSAKLGETSEAEAEDAVLSLVGLSVEQTGGGFTQAIHHFDIAVATGKVRPFVRKFQFGGVIYLD